MKLHHILISSLIVASTVPMFATSDTDSKIVDAAKASYNYRTLFEDKVTVRADDGIVTLTGTVADRDLKSVAEDTVTGIPGVMRVDNQIKIDSELKEHSDAWIAWKIRYQLLVRANVSNSNTKVDVKDGAVLLTGTAENTAQKELTGVYAKEINGVKSLRNELVVTANAADTKTVAETMDDASITSQVKFALFSHKSTSALKTKVTTTNGVVAITGVAANDAEKSLVGKLATSIRGVKSVNNDMTVKS
jgi:osmotically-inducible protein OsmY